MILNDTAISRWAKGGGISPFNPKMINPASIDLCLGNTIRVPRWYWQPFIWRIAYRLGWPRWTELRKFDTYLLRPHQFVLCSSLETTRIPDNILSLLLSKSSTGRCGIEHLHAGLGDPGFGDNGRGGADWTWELVNVAPWPNLLEAGKPLMQLVMARLVDVPEKLYKDTGKYNNQMGPTMAR